MTTFYFLWLGIGAVTALTLDLSVPTSGKYDYCQRFNVWVYCIALGPVGATALTIYALGRLARKW